MSQAGLFYESLEDAIREAVRACGGVKLVACKLWPEKTPDAAGRALSDCMNENREARLTPDQLLLVIKMARDRGCHAVMSFMSMDAGYAPPQPIEPADEAAELQRQYIESTKALLKMAERIERLRSVA